MGRGLGVFQKRILAVLEADPDLEVEDLARVLEITPRSAAYHNLLATLGTLEARALVQTYSFLDRRSYHACNALCVRLPSEQPNRFPPVVDKMPAEVTTARAAPSAYVSLPAPRRISQLAESAEPVRPPEQSTNPYTRRKMQNHGAYQKRKAAKCSRPS